MVGTALGLQSYLTIHSLKASFVLERMVLETSVRKPGFFLVVSQSSCAVGRGIPNVFHCVSAVKTWLAVAVQAANRSLGSLQMWYCVWNLKVRSSCAEWLVGCLVPGILLGWGRVPEPVLVRLFVFG